MKNSVDYVILYVDDLERSVAFYRDIVGLPFKLFGDGYAEFATGGTKFGLYERARLPDLIGADALPSSRCGEVAFLVEDVDAEAERLRETSATILSGPVDRAWGHRTVHALDPDGHVVEFAQEIPRRTVRNSEG
jgi:lactoylglutathione lyase